MPSQQTATTSHARGQVHHLAPRRLSAYAVAELSRRVAMRFVAGVTRGWNRRELVAWLVDHHDLALWSAREPEPPASSRRRAPIAQQSVRSVVERAHHRVTEQMLALRDPERGHAFAAEVVLDGLVQPFIDRNGRRGWMPVAWRRMSLTERVLSLVAVDYLVRPREYEQQLWCCPNCERLEFREPHAMRRGDRGCGVCMPLLRESPVPVRLLRAEIRGWAA